MNLGILDKVDDASTITTEQVSEALGGAEISEQANVSKVLIAVTEVHAKLEQLIILIHTDWKISWTSFRSSAMI